MSGMPCSWQGAGWPGSSSAAAGTCSSDVQRKPRTVRRSRPPETMSGYLSISDLLKAERSMAVRRSSALQRLDARLKLAMVVAAVLINVVLLDYRLSLGLLLAAWAG